MLIAPFQLETVPLMVGVPARLTALEEQRLRAALTEAPYFLSEAGWFPYGRAGTFAALARATQLIIQGTSRFVMVGGVDSLCASDMVDELVQAGRVLGPHTEGTIPGEAAAFALLARADDPLAGASTAVRLETVALQRAKVPFAEAEQISSDALTATFRTLREGGSGRVDRIIAAHSGEGYFGRSFAHAYLRETDVMPEPLEVELIADRVGDTGAAAGILGMAFGAYLMVKDARPGGSRVLVYSESDTGEIGAAILEGAPVHWRRNALTRAVTAGS
jgi:3-oxoacyl-[acyl-carrier-protein] synthase-1